jgi:hypothetical protein
MIKLLRFIVTPVATLLAFLPTLPCASPILIVAPAGYDTVDGPAS